MALSTLLIATLATTAIGGGVSAYSAISASNAQAKADNFNAQVAEQNSKLASEQAARQASLVRDKNRRIQSRQKAMYAAAGVRLDGTVTDVLKDSAVQGELDALATEYSGAIASTSYTNQAKLSRMSASNAKSAGPLAATGTILGSVAQMGSITTNYFKKT